MRKLILASLIQLMVLSYGNAQKFEMDTLQFNGNVDNHINIVIMGDGYTAAEQDNFIGAATNLSNYLFTQSPWSNYKNYFNIFAIRVISSQSGAKHPNTSSDCGTAYPLVPVSNPNTYFGSSFDSYGIHRLIVPANITNIVKVISTNFPNYDEVLIIANTPYYGGSGGNVSTSTIEKSSPEIVAHEMGHSFANLADEYYAGITYTSEKPNMTRQTNPALVKWKNWVGFNGVGIYQHCCGGNSAQWYKPYTTCKMEYLGYPYCNVCQEAIIEKIHSLVNPIISYTPSTLSINSSEQFIDFKLNELIKPNPNTLNIQWELDGLNVSNNIDSFQLDQNILTNSTHTLTVTLVDTTTLSRVDNHSTKHFSTVTWEINKTITGTQLTSSYNKIIYLVFPNPASNILNVSVELENKDNLSIQIYSLEGKLMQEVSNEKLIDKKYLNSLSIGQLTNGTYALVFKIGSITHTELFIKQ